jgi:hypothetical protein
VTWQPNGPIQRSPSERLVIERSTDRLSPPERG